MMATMPVTAFDLAALNQPAVTSPAIYGPPDMSEPSPAPDAGRYASVGGKIAAVKWEVAGIVAYTTVTQVLLTDAGRSFHFQEEGWFGKDTKVLGLDKLAHAHNAYVLADLLHWRITRKSGGLPGDAMTAAALAMGLQFYTELFDAHKQESGFSYQDVLFNTGGALFSALRNTTPGLKDKVDFRLMITPSSEIYTPKGRGHYRQQRYILAATLSGFEGLRDSPFRFLELHAGYYATGFTAPERARGDPRRRRPYLGVGFNFKELFFRSPRSFGGRAAGAVLDYLQIPYTSRALIR
jgi:hypothetical protein